MRIKLAALRSSKSSDGSAVRRHCDALLKATVPVALLFTLTALPLQTAGATLGWNADALSATFTKADKLPPPAEGVTPITFSELFKTPAGPRGMEYTETARKLDGKLVRILGFMIHQDQSVPGIMVISPFKGATDEAEYGLCDDLPMSVVFVAVPKYHAKVVPFTPEPLLLTGRLELGPHTEADGRVSHVRLSLASGDDDQPITSTP